MKKDNTRKGKELGLPIINDLTNKELSKELEIADNKDCPIEINNQNKSQAEFVFTDAQITQIRKRLTPACLDNLYLAFLENIESSNLKNAKEKLKEFGNRILHLKSEFKISKRIYKKKKYLYINFGLSIPFLIKTIAACMDVKDKNEELKIIGKASEEMMDIILKALMKSEYFIGCKNGHSAEIAQLGYNTLVLPLIALFPNPEILDQEMNFEDNIMSTSFKNNAIDITKTVDILFTKMNIEYKFWIKADAVYEIEKFSRGYKYLRYKTKRK